MLRGRPTGVESVLSRAEHERIVGSGAAAAARQEKLCSVWSGLLEVYSPRDAELWLRTPRGEQAPPLEIMAGETGLDTVLEIVGRLTWGIQS